MSLQLTNLSGFGAGAGAAAAPVTVTEVAFGSATGNSPYNVFGSLSLDAGNYIVLISCRHNSGTGSRSFSSFTGSGTGGTITDTTLVTQSRTNGGIGVMTIVAMTVSANMTNVTLQAAYSGNLTHCAMWVYKIENAVAPTAAIDTASTTGATAGTDFTLNTTGYTSAAVFCVIQATAGVTSSCSLGTVVKSSNTYNHETDGVGQAFSISEATGGAGETGWTYSGDTTHRVSVACSVG